MRLVAARPLAAPVVLPAIPVTISQPSRGLILVVEDNEVNQLVARSMVAKLGYEADVVADGSEAVAATAATEYAAVLMDCHMPVMDGFEATKAIRARHDGRRRLPVIAMTAGALDEDRERCLAAGMDDYLTKPVDVDKLERVLSRWIPETSKEGGGTVLDPARLETLRDLGPADGLGLLPAAAEAFRQDIQPSLEALRHALDNGSRDTFRHVAHKLKGAAANIGAARAARMCEELERSSSSGGPVDPALLAGLEAELGLVDKALDHALSVAS
jgi:CheY-like chemotaxis protein